MVELLKYFGISSLLLFIAGFLAKYLIFNILKRDLEKYKTKMQRELAEEARRDSYKSELAIRQLNAAEEMWSLFKVTSLSNVGDTIIVNPSGNNPQFLFDKAIAFVDKFNDVFSSKAGLYMSEETKTSLHIFRDFINNEMIKKYRTTHNRALTESQLKEFKRLRTDARLKLRSEVGSVDLTIARDEYKSVK